MTKIIKFISSMVISFSLLVSFEFSSYSQNIGISTTPRPLHYMGLEWDSPEDMKPYLLTDDRSKTVTLPTSVDNSYLYPIPMDQDNNDCVAWALAYAQMSVLQTLKWEWTANTSNHIFSPSFLFNYMNKGVNKGLNILDTLKDIVNVGFCPSTYYPVKTSLQSNLPALAQVAASLYKPSSFYITTSQTQIKQAIAEGKGVVIGVVVYDDLYYHLTPTNDTYNLKDGTNHGNHAICLVGYDDSRQAFKFINSWGTDWGVNGYGWISYDFVADTTINHHGSNRGYVMNYSSNVDYVMGDSNLDNTITAADSRLALRYTADLETFTDRQQVLSDVDGDGNVSAADARNILNYSAGNLTKFPLYE